MPEIKNQFTGGKMNKDLDERLVPKGEYRDAMNIQVSTSEGSDVGTVQNILGNKLIDISPVTISSNSICIGAVSDEKNDAFYWFVREDGTKDIIFEYKLGLVKPVFVDTKVGTDDAVLKFTDKPITGINIIDGMIFWTDSYSEPKKINIERSIEGTNLNGNTHTSLINPFINISPSNPLDIKEDHITVIRKAPKSALTVRTEADPNFAYGTTNSGINFLSDPTNPALGNIPVGDEFDMLLLKDPNSTTELQVGDSVLFNPSLSSALPNIEHQVKANLVSIVNDGSSNFMSGNTVLFLAGTWEIWTLNMVSIANVSSNNLTYNWAVQFDFNNNFKNIFPRFSYRYKYIDGEYSSFAPFTTVVFEPKNFLYDVKEAYNKGMENNISKIFVGNYNNNIPKDVKSLDIIYKESNSPSVYIVDTIEGVNMTATRSIGQTPEYEVRPNQIKALLPENQLLRSYDNVPKSALAQEISGSRIIYANYLQNYNVDINPSVSASLRQRKNENYVNYSDAKKSLKSIRNYSLGVSYLDKYGRQTPVFTDKKGDVQINIDKSNNSNQISTRVYGTAPEWAEYYKIFVKDTSTEYYNLAMDRLYDARDGNVWLSFPSSDRNKVDDETFLILKKGVSGSDAVSENNKYKILAIENEAPDFIKTELKSYGSAREDNATPGTLDLFSAGDGYPIENSREIKIDVGQWNLNALALPTDGEFELRFSTLDGTLELKSEFYEVINFEDDGAHYIFQLKKGITEADNFLTNPTNNTLPNDSLGIEVFLKEVENLPQFDGRFFVKVSRDITIQTYIEQQAISSLLIQQQPVASVPFYYLSDPGSWNQVNTSGNTVTNTDTEWEAFFTQNVGKSCWFIDAAYYKGFFGPNDKDYLNKNGLPYLGSNSNSYSTQTDQTGATGGYNKGIWTDANGQTWMYLTFGYIKADDNSSFFNSVTNLQDSTPSNSQIVAAANSHARNWMVTANTPDPNGIEALTGGTWDYGQQDDRLNIWKVGDPIANPEHADQLNVVLNLTQNKRFRFSNDAGETIYIINAPVEKYYHLNYYNLDDMESGVNDADALWFSGSSNSQLLPAAELYIKEVAKMGHSRNRRITYRIPIQSLDPSLPNSPIDPASTFNPLSVANGTTTGTIQFIEPVYVSPEGQVVSSDPAIWETEPKQDIDLDIYREVDGTFPIEINNDTNYIFAPVGSKVVHPDISIIPAGIEVVSWDNNILKVNTVLNDSNMNQTNGSVYFHRPDGSCVSAELLYLHNPTPAFGGGNESLEVVINPNVLNKTVDLSWFNCYSFENGVESDRVRDDFNQVRIDKGAKASSTIDEPYEEEHRKYGLIYSGLYNSISGVNNLNQFIAAEKITKDVNPTYGSIQKLFSRDSDLIAMCEDKTLKILANKDAVFNADGNPQLTANQNVLGQTIPFVGDYGISTNPESFASESYRAYFTDKVRGTVMRLSKDGLTPISEHGMKDYFRDNLKLSNKLIGSYDDKKNEYNLTLEQTTEQIPKTVSFKENVRGWVSFKSFVPEYAISCANEYYTFKGGNAYKHHDESKPRNTFYGIHNPNSYSTLTTLFNENPGVIKSFNTVNYEGSKSKIDQFVADPTTGLTDNQYYNLSAEQGWYVEDIYTNKESGSVSEFIEKEGKWFNYIKGRDIASNLNVVDISTFDQASFAIQGLGILQVAGVSSAVLGCTNPNATNYNSNATVDDGSCIIISSQVFGCMDPNASNYYPSATTADTSCLWFGCTDVNAVNYDPNVFVGASSFSTYPANMVDDGSCISSVPGCTDSTAINFDINATVDDGSCIAKVPGCTVTTANNYDATTNFDDGSCTWYGCTNPLASNYNSFPLSLNYPAIPGSGVIDDGSCLDGGCTDVNADNFDPLALWDDNSCQYCDFTTGSASYSGIPFTSLTLNTSAPSLSNGQIAITPNPQAPYLPHTYELLDVNGNVISNSPTAGQSINGVFASNSFLFANLAAGTYVLQLTSSNGVCIQSFPNISITIGATPQQLGCTNADACNFDFPLDALHADDGSCEFTTCSGCTDTAAANFGLQNNSSSTPPPPCTVGGSGVSGSCTISCGDGSTNTSFANSCCEYPVFSGCTDATAINYDSTATVDDGTCIDAVYGCTDASASNYDPTANTDDGSCISPVVITGCTDPTACNFNPNATIQGDFYSHETCVYQHQSITVGGTDPNFGLVGPVYYQDGVFDPFFTNTDKKVKHYVLGPTWPLTSNASKDIGFSMTKSYGSISPYDTFGNYQSMKNRIYLYKKSDPTDASSNWDLVHSTININMSLFSQSNGTFGERQYNNTPSNTTGTIPYPFGISQTSVSNYEFDVYYNSTVKNQYKIEQYFSLQVGSSTQVYGFANGALNGDGTTCGSSYQFQIAEASCVDHVGAVLGCTDDQACNHDLNATCDDGSCYYGTAIYFTPTPGNQSNCYACEIPSGNCTSNMPNCPTDVFGNYDFWNATSNPNGNIFTTQALCDANDGAA